MAVYTINDWIQSKKSIKARMAAILTLIETLETMLDEAKFKSGVQEYQLNTGQSIIRTEYKSISEVTNEIEFLERRYHRLQNRGIGWRFKLRDKDTFL